MTYQQIGVPPEDAQFLETRKFQRSEIAGIFRIPPHMIGDLERATFSNIEHQSLEFVKYSLVPWLVQIEQSLKRDLFALGDGKRTHFAEHLVDGLLRGDVTSRYSAYQIARQNGWMNADEEGTTYLWPANMVPAQIALDPPEPAPVAAPVAEPATEDGEDENEE